jgi:hypothetical protein
MPRAFARSNIRPRSTSRWQRRPQCPAVHRAERCPADTVGMPCEKGNQSRSGPVSALLQPEARHPAHSARRISQDQPSCVSGAFVGLHRTYGTSVSPVGCFADSPMAAASKCGRREGVEKSTSTATGYASSTQTSSAHRHLPANAASAPPHGTTGQHPRYSVCDRAADVDGRQLAHHEQC